MKIKVSSLNEILNKLDNEQLSSFIESYQEEVKKNPFLYKYLNQKLSKKNIEYPNDEKSCEPFFNKNKEVLDIMDTFSKETRACFVSYLGILNIVNQNIEFEEYKQKTKKLEKMGIDNIIFGFNPLRRKQESSIISKNLKSYIKYEDGKKIESLKIYSNGIINNLKISIDKNNQKSLIACIFDLKDQTFVLETNNQKNLYLLGAKIDIKDIEQIDLTPNDFQFNENIENIQKELNIDQYNYHLEMEYPILNNKNPKKLYKKE